MFVLPELLTELLFLAVPLEGVVLGLAPVEGLAGWALVAGLVGLEPVEGLAGFALDCPAEDLPCLHATGAWRTSVGR